MSKIINPLFSGTAAHVPVTAGANPDAGVPRSPISGRPMVRTLCHKVPVYVDMENRIVVPVRLSQG